MRRGGRKVERALAERRDKVRFYFSGGRSEAQLKFRGMDEVREEKVSEPVGVAEAVIEVGGGSAGGEEGVGVEADR